MFMKRLAVMGRYRIAMKTVSATATRRNAEITMVTITAHP
jgi:hypothetical protein